MNQNRKNFKKLISNEQSSWLKKAKRRKKWRWLLKIIFKLKIKYYFLKREFKHLK